MPSLSHHNLLLLWTQLLVLVVAAKLAATVAVRLRQPPVIGEIAAGVLLGPSVLGNAWPVAGSWLVPSDPLAAAPLSAIAWIGAAFLLVLTGLETDLRIVVRFRRAVSLIAIGAIVIPAGTGFLIARHLPSTFAGPASSPNLLAMFMAISLGISSLPVIAKILTELGYVRRDFAQIVLGVGMLNDLVGWLALGFLVTLSRAGVLTPGGVAFSIAAVVGVIATAVIVGPYLVDAMLQWIRRRDRSPAAAIGVTAGLTFALATATQAVGSDAMLGAYITGIVITRCRFPDVRVRSHLETVTYAIFAPIFFATAGLRMNLGLLAHRQALMGAALILISAAISKPVGAYLAARGSGICRRDGLAVAIGLNARGAVEIVIASVGLALGVLSQAAYTAVALMAILTSAVTPPLLTAVVRNWAGSPQEQARLGREGSLQRNLLIRPGRLLLSLGTDSRCLSVANLLHRAWPLEAGVTIVPEGRVRSASPRALRRSRDANLERLLDGREVSYRAPARQAHSVLYAPELGYSAMGITLHPNGNGNGAAHSISPVAMRLLTRGGIPLVVVRCLAGHQGTSYDRIVVPVAGTRASEGALELALGLAETASTEILLLHVTDGIGTTDASLAVLEHAVSTVRTGRVAVQASVRHGSSVTSGILDTASANTGGLIVLGAALRRTREGFCFSQAVQKILAQADSAVAVVVTPERQID